MIHSSDEICQIKVHQNEYEKIPFINDGNCTLTDYSAFFGSKKCFDYFLMKQPDYNIKNCLKYVIAGGNKEILSKLNFYNITYENSLNFASQFHHNDLFYWIVNNNYDEYNSYLYESSLNSYNLTTFFSITNKAFSLFDFFISSITSNIFNIYLYSLDLLKFFDKENYLNTLKDYAYFISL